MSQDSPKRTYIAQLTDMHVIDPLNHDELFVDVNGRMMEAVDSINAESPRIDLVLATGDLTNWGRVEQYEQLTELLNPLEAPVLAIPGNHDDRTRLRECFPGLAWADTAHASWDTVVNDHIRIIGLDTTIPGEGGAAFDAEREAWLTEALATPANADVQQTVLAMHHPPFMSGIKWMDDSGFENLDRLVNLLRGSSVDRILCGHLHRPVQSVVAGIPAMVGISTIQHVALNLDINAPVTLIRDPAGYQIHCFEDDQSVTHTRYIASEEQAFTPDWAL